MLKTMCVGMVFVASFAGCGGSGSDGSALGREDSQGSSGASLLSFSGSGCKKETLSRSPHSVAPVRTIESASGTSVQALDAADFASEVEGLQCIAWERSASDVLSIALINFESVCGAQWSGAVAVDSEGILNLDLTNPECRIAACGQCIYDWNFAVQGVPEGTAVPVVVGLDTCPGQRSAEKESLVIPANAAARGIACRYADWNALGWQARVLSTCGQAGMPCEGTSGLCSDAAGSLSCAEGLTCTDNGNASQRICAKSCTGDPDCGSSGAQVCSAGFCRPNGLW